MIDLITVVFRDEIHLLRIQAQSINQYINSNDIGTITVIVNDSDDVVKQIDKSWYNHQKVQIVPYSKWNYISTTTGWENQQLCKLLAASESTSPWSLVLDAKTWFIKPFELTKLFDSQGRAQVGPGNISPYFISSQTFIEKYFNISMPVIVGPAGVPFVFHTDTVKSMIANIDNFIDFFQTNVKYPNLITEFHLYSGYLINTNKLDKLYNIDIKTQYYYPFNIASQEADNFDKFFNVITNPGTSTVSIHRNAYKHLTNDQIQRWAQFLIDKNILQGAEQLNLN